LAEALALVVDIEGTTSATRFIVDQLYPYSRERFAGWIDERGDDPEVARVIAQVRELTGEPRASTRRIVSVLNAWLDRDEKIAPLKTLQGRIWQDGFATGQLTAHFYPDVIPSLRAWKAAGHELYVFSSGSVSAQRAWFGHSPEGDLLPLFSRLFDTENAGPKRAASSYHAIAAAVATDPSLLVFLSDLVSELDAAREAGWHTVGVRRPGEHHHAQGVGDHLEVASFACLDLSGERPFSQRQR
jgi:enolase-phosphatase E1